MLDGYGYTYNPQGDVATRQNLALDAYKAANPSSTAPYLDQVYANDELDQLTSLTQGELNAATDQIMAGTTDFTQNWTLDGNGNWANSSQTEGGTTVSQDRQTNAINQIENYNDPSDVSTSSWAVPGYDSAGNMTTVPQPGNEATGLTCQYDAWNRLAAVYSGSMLVAAYVYDGRNRLIETESDFVAGSPQSVVHDYYAGEQLIETRVAAGGGLERHGPGAESGVSIRLVGQREQLAHASRYLFRRHTRAGRPHLLPDRRQRQRDGGHRFVGQRAGAVCLQRLRRGDGLHARLVEQFAGLLIVDQQHDPVRGHAA